MFMYFFFNDTATPEIYTYLHTLALHDALPISGSRLQKAAQVLLGPGAHRAAARRVHSAHRRWVRQRCGVACDPAPAHRIVERLAQHARSEEHTSELQSLMRISYAVFCLKKKKKNQQKTHRKHSKHR